MSLVRSGEGRVISCGSDCFLVSLILRTKLSNIPSSAVQDRRKPPGVASETRRLSTSSSASRGEKTVEEGGNKSVNQQSTQSSSWWDTEYGGSSVFRDRVS